MSVKKRNWLGRGVFWGAIALIAMVALLTTLREQPVWVDVATVSRQPLEVTIVEEGRTRVQDRFVVSAPVAGYVRRIELEVGERVAQGQLLTRLEPLRSEVLDARSRAEAEAMVAAAQASLAAAEQQVAAVQADQQLAASELKRIAQLAEKQLVSQDVLQQTQAAAARTDAALRSARFGVDVARHQLQAARTRVSVSAASSGAASTDLVDIVAPVSGAVLQRLRQSEGVVAPGQSLLELGDPTALEVEVDVQSFDAVRIQPGTEVRLTGWGGEPLQAIVRTVEPVGFTKVSALGVEEQRVHVVLDITAPPEQWALLGDGYRVDAHFILWRGEDVLVVPESALFRRGDLHYVFVVDGDIARERVVETGNSDGFRIAVRSGLEEGEQVVRHPDNSLSSGARVRSRL